jgi:L-phenylalanine/L-methionine N-acetyltransferase
MAYPADWETTFTAKNGKKVRFRPEKASDTDMLWQMFSTLSEESVSYLIPPFTLERIEEWTSNIDYNEVLAVVATVDEQGVQRIIGTSSLRFFAEEVFKHKAEFGLTVHDDYQNLGIGTALLNHMLEFAKKKGLSKVFLVVNTNNLKAVHLYNKAGFEIEGTLREEMHLDGKIVDHYRMALFLNRQK